MAESSKRRGHENTYSIAPKRSEKFPVGKVKAMIKEVLKEKLEDKTYQADHTSSWTKDISDEVKNRLKELGLPRYKLMVQTLIGERRGQGVRMGSRCFWDSNTDNSASESFNNSSLFAVVVAYGVYLN